MKTLSKMKTTFISAILIIAITCAMLVIGAVTASAADIAEPKNLRVNMNTITDKDGNITGDTSNSSEGWSYDAATNTLTLNNVNFTKTYNTMTDGVIFYTGSDLTVNLIGNNVFNCFDNLDRNVFSIFCGDNTAATTNLTITGTGSLTANGDIVLQAGGLLKIDGPTIKATTIQSYGDLDIKNADITVTEDGINAYGISIDNSVINSYGSRMGIYSQKSSNSEAQFTIKNSYLDLSGGSYGLYSYNYTTIQGCQINSTGPNSKSIYYYTTKELSDSVIKDKKSATVYGNATLFNDLTIASGETLTISDGGSITLNGKTLTNNGTIILPADATKETVAGMDIKGTGTIQAGDAICDNSGVCQTHSFSESVCSFCSYTCNHDNITNGICDLCKSLCPHDGEYGFCSKCGYLPVNDVNFPDPAFRNYIMQYTTSDKAYLTPNDINNITIINVIGKYIFDLSGIEFFTELEVLHAKNNNLSRVDLSKNTKLTSINLSENALTDIDLSANTALTSASLDSQYIDVLIDQRTMSIELSSITSNPEKFRITSGGSVDGSKISVNEGAEVLMFASEAVSSTVFSITGYITIENPHRHELSETEDAEFIITPADCSHFAIYSKSCSCGYASATETFNGSTYNSEIHTPDETKWYSTGAIAHARHCVYCEEVCNETTDYHIIVEGSHFTRTEFDPEYLNTDSYKLFYGFECEICGKGDYYTCNITVSSFDEDATLESPATCKDFAVYTYERSEYISNNIEKYNYIYTLVGTALDPSNHSSEETYYVNDGENKHDKLHSCCNAVAVDDEACYGGSATCTEKAVCEICETEYGTTLAHTFNVLEKDADGHWYKCEDCTATDEKLIHSGGSATCTEKAICEICDTKYGTTLSHTFNVLERDADGHWYKCKDCTATDEKLVHSGGSATCTEKAVCSVCSESYGELAPHAYSKVETDKSTHTEKCDICEAFGENAAHTYGDDNKCTECGYKKSTGLPAPAIVGIAIGGTGAVGIGAFAAYWFIFRKKKI